MKQTNAHQNGKKFHRGKREDPEEKKLLLLKESDGGTRQEERKLVVMVSERERRWAFGVSQALTSRPWEASAEVESFV